MKRKVKRYNGEDGSSVEGMKKGLFGAKADKEDMTDERFKASVQPNTKLPSAKEKTGTYGPSSSAEPASFKEAFAAARKAGDSSFSFNGKKFTTETAGAKKSEGVLKNAADEMEKGRASQSRLSDSIRDDEATSRNTYLKTRDLPSADYAAQARLAQKVASGIPEAKSKRDLIRGAVISAKEGMRKGGAVKKMASGGMAKGGSASSRGDGCAMRGKTRGKIY